jgi:hypothetical protein
MVEAPESRDFYWLFTSWRERIWGKANQHCAGLLKFLGRSSFVRLGKMDRLPFLDTGRDTLNAMIALQHGPLRSGVERRRIN